MWSVISSILAGSFDCTSPTLPFRRRTRRVFHINKMFRSITPVEILPPPRKKCQVQNLILFQFFSAISADLKPDLKPGTDGTFSGFPARRYSAYARDRPRQEHAGKTGQNRGQTERSPVFWRTDTERLPVISPGRSMAVETNGGTFRLSPVLAGFSAGARRPAPPLPRMPARPRRKLPPPPPRLP